MVVTIMIVIVMMMKMMTNICGILEDVDDYYQLVDLDACISATRYVKEDDDDGGGDHNDCDCDDDDDDQHYFDR